MEQHDAGLDQVNEGDGNPVAVATKNTRFGSGLHEESPFPDNTPFAPAHVGDDSIQGSCDAGEARSEVPRSPQPEQQAFVGADGQVHELPSELIGPDGKMLPFTEKTIAMLRGKYFTVRHVLLTDCGHRIDMTNEPKTNCENCWFQWLNRHGKLVETADQFFREYGKPRLVAMRGAKFVRNFLRFMSTIAHFAAEQKAQGETNGNNDQQGRGGNQPTEGREGGEGRTSEATNSGGETEAGQVSDTQPQQ